MEMPANVPATPAMALLIVAMMVLTTNPSTNLLLSHATRYHSRLNPGGGNTNCETLLKESMTATTIGLSRKTETSPT